MRIQRDSEGACAGTGLLSQAADGCEPSMRDRQGLNNQRVGGPDLQEQSMSFDVRIDGGPRVVVSGELDIATSPELTSAIESLERTEAQRVVLDLSC